MIRKKTTHVVITFIMLGLIITCGGKKSMFNNVNDLLSVMKKHTPVVILGDPNGKMLAVTPEYGSKVIAMSVTGLQGRNLIWPNPQIATDQFWSGAQRNWNLGGARTWLAPEADFYLDAQRNWFVPEAMDPGNYKLERQEGNLIVCSNEFHIKNVNAEEYHLNIIRTIELLTETPDFVQTGLQYVGLRFTHELVNLSNKTIGQDLAYASLWSLIQLDTAGTMIVPIRKDSAHHNITVRDYGPTNFNTVPPERMTVGDDWIAVKIDGKFRCKLGFAPWAARNGIAYLSYRQGEDQGVLYLKEFTVDPTAVYVDHPWEKPYDYGDAIQLYNDDGRFGGFCEIECHAPAKILAPNDKLSHTVTLSVILGPLDQLKQIAGQKLAVDMNSIALY
ncbi:MAG: hypothetical protein ONB11_01400 [candidate division KSB1 bacterium]|nr:hypothetical protein [candidate division KSB1 bacterium]